MFQLMFCGVMNAKFLFNKLLINQTIKFAQFVILK